MARPSCRGESLAEYSVILAMTVTVIAASLNPLSQVVSSVLQESGQVLTRQLAPRQTPAAPPQVEMQGIDLPDLGSLGPRNGDQFTIEQVDTGDGGLIITGTGNTTSD